MVAVPFTPTETVRKGMKACNAPFSRLLALAAALTAVAAQSSTPSPSPSPAAVCNIRTVVGTGAGTSTGDGGQGTAATVKMPVSFASNDTWLYITEAEGARLRRLNLATGIITTFAGTGSTTGTFLGVAATSANLGALVQPLILPNGDVAVTLYWRCAVVGINAATLVTYAIAGTGTCLGAGGTASDAVAASGVAFGECRFLVLWGADGLFVSTMSDHRVRLVNLTTGACMRRSGVGRVGGWGGGE
jgi:hypothetical protein